MTPERWDVVKEVFHQAAQVPPGALPKFLDTACHGDFALRREVESLLDSDGDPMTLLEPLGEVPEAAPPTSIGAYKFLHGIGSGGMSEVFLAVRSDDEYHQRVAVKLIRDGLLSDDVLRRFKQERQILAGLEHPFIARLLDGGTTEAGLPFLVMEYVEGWAVDEYCRRQRLSVEERLELLRPICQAVQHAHRNLVVHRDLKPSNVLVTAEGIPKLLDFGVAKLLNPELSAGQVSATRPGAHALTLGYASPEQVAGEPITTASDVYSLGVMLYELLVGQRPFRLAGLSLTAAQRRICEEEPVPPSRAVHRSPGEGGEGVQAPKLSRDLDAIVLKALRKEPLRRYGSAAELEEDIVRYLQHQPVRARPSTWSYRAAKFVRRNRLGVALLAALVIFGVAMAVQTLRLSRALDQAGQERAKAERVSDFLIEMFHLADPRQTRSRSMTAVEFLNRGAEQATVRLQDQPLIRAALLDTLGRVYRNLGLFEEAEPLLQEGFRLRREHLGEEDLEVASSLSHLAELRNAQAQYPQAVALNRQALGLRRRLAGEDSILAAASLQGLAEVLHTSGDYEAAKQAYQEALKLRRRHLGEESPEVAESLSDLGYLFFDLGRFEEAEEHLRRALDLCRRVYSDPHLVTAYTLSYLAGVLEERGDLEAAEPFSRESLEMHRLLLGDEHPDTSTASGALGGLLLKMGEVEEGEALLRQSLDRQVQTLGEDHPVVGTHLVNLARALKERGDLDAAEPLLIQADAIFRHTFEADHPARMTTQEYLADIYRLRGEAQKALASYERIYEVRKRTLAPENPQMAFSMIRLGLSHWEVGDPESGEDFLRRATQIVRKAYLPGDWRIAYVESEWAGVLLELGRSAEAEKLLRQAIPHLEASQDPDASGKLLAAARQRLEDLVRIREAKGSPRSPAPR